MANKTFTVPPTKNGYDFFEATSSLQKAIRRCDEDQALFWSVEMYETNRAEYVWQRLFVMVSEDIGLANPNLPAQINALYQNFNYLKGKAGEPEKLPYIQAVLAMVRSDKSRLVDWALIDAFRNHSKRLSPEQVPDYALDKHTRRGKQKGRGFPHFFEDGAFMNQHKKQDREDEYEASSREILIGREDFPKDLFGEEIEPEQN